MAFNTKFKVILNKHLLHNNSKSADLYKPIKKVIKYI